MGGCYGEERCSAPTQGPLGWRGHNGPQLQRCNQAGLPELQPVDRGTERLSLPFHAPSLSKPRAAADAHSPSPLSRSAREQNSQGQGCASPCHPSGNTQRFPSHKQRGCPHPPAATAQPGGAQSDAEPERGGGGLTPMAHMYLYVCVCLPSHARTPVTPSLSLQPWHASPARALLAGSSWASAAVPRPEAASIYPSIHPSSHPSPQLRAGGWRHRIASLLPSAAAP